MPPRKSRYEPSDLVWIAAATQAAKDARLKPGLVLAGDHRPAYCEARWRAWKSVLDMSPAYSIGGLGRVTGWNHTSILAGLRRLDEIDASRADEQRRFVVDKPKNTIPSGLPAMVNQE